MYCEEPNEYDRSERYKQTAAKLRERGIEMTPEQVESKHKVLDAMATDILLEQGHDVPEQESRRIAAGVAAAVLDGRARVEEVGRPAATMKRLRLWQLHRRWMDWGTTCGVDLGNISIQFFFHPLKGILAISRDAPMFGKWRLGLGLLAFTLQVVYISAAKVEAERNRVFGEFMKSMEAGGDEPVEIT